MNTSFQLIPFPSQRHPKITITGLLVFTDQRLSLRYRIAGDWRTVLLPKQIAQDKRDNLWQSTCFECFLLLPDGQAYIELNFAPSGHWNAYLFDAYRKRSKETCPVKLVSLHGQIEDDSYVIEACVDHLPASMTQCGVSAVIDANTLSYWALAHDAKAPDFHLASSFIL